MDTITLENTGRDVLVFPVLDNPKAKRPKVVKRVIIGPLSASPQNKDGNRTVFHDGTHGIDTARVVRLNRVGPQLQRHARMQV